MDFFPSLFPLQMHLCLILAWKRKSLLKSDMGKLHLKGQLLNQNQNTCSENAVHISQCIPMCILCTVLEGCNGGVLVWQEWCSNRPTGESLFRLTCDGARSQSKWDHLCSHSALQWSVLFHLFLPLSLLFPVGITCVEILSFWQIKVPHLPVFLGYLAKVSGIKHLR